MFPSQYTVLFPMHISEKLERFSVQMLVEISLIGNGHTFSRAKLGLMAVKRAKAVIGFL